MRGTESWSAARLSEAADRSILVINPIVYTGLSMGFPTIEQLDAVLGAHASVAGYRLITRDARRYRLSFSRLDLIAPD